MLKKDQNHVKWDYWFTFLEKAQKQEFHCLQPKKARKWIYFLQAEKATKNINLVLCKQKNSKNIKNNFCKLKLTQQTWFSFFYAKNAQKR